MKKLKLLTIVGTRPEIIRLSRTMALLDQHLTQVIVHTGQNYDYELNEIFWEQLELRKPDHFLNVDTTSLGSAIGDILKKTEEVLKLEKPDALLVLGDTNSCLAAYMAKRMHIPVFHMEAGNRSYDFNVPEEINRRIIDHIADFNLVYTEHARRHLLSEGLPHRRIYLTGSPMKEVLDYYKPKIDRSDILEKLSAISYQLSANIQEPIANSHQLTAESQKPKAESREPKAESQKLKAKSYFLVSIHREENVDNPENLQKILLILNQLAENYTLPVIVSTHPRTRKRLETLGTENTNQTNPEHNSQISKFPNSQINPLIHFLKPFGFLDYVHLQMHALCTISDSGTISEESSILNFPAISLRQSMERPEAQDTGSIILTGFDPDRVLAAIQLCIDQFKAGIPTEVPADYAITNTSWRVLKLILGNTGLSNLWHGVKE